MLKQKQIWMAVMLVSLVVPAYAGKQAGERQSRQAHDEVGAGSITQPSMADDPNYQIGAQDVLDINVWKEPDISRMVPVRPDGKISLPLLNDVQAAGLTPAQLAAQITTGLAKYMTNPQVTVIVNQINSQRFYILGQVNRAGAYLLLPGMTVLQALSNAGGFTEFANVKHIYLLRQENGKGEKLFFNYKEVASGKHNEQNIMIKIGDTIFVP
jgi:polysaccharide export outer membrane protein